MSLHCKTKEKRNMKQSQLDKEVQLLTDYRKLSKDSQLAVLSNVSGMLLAQREAQKDAARAKKNKEAGGV